MAGMVGITPAMTPTPIEPTVPAALIRAPRDLPKPVGWAPYPLEGGVRMARVLDRDGRPIPGLWAAGADMSTMMGGRYPAGGITLGPAMTFAHVAAKDAAATDPRYPEVE